jgi:hypothetical protein
LLAAMVTVAGTPATEVLLLESVTTAPLEGAGPFKLTVPVEDVPPATLVGFRLKEVRTAGKTTNAAARAVPLTVAEIVTVVLLATALVATTKVPVVAFEGMATETGTVATEGLLVVSATLIPPEGAGPLSTNVPVAPFPPKTVFGFNVTEDKMIEGGNTARLAFRITFSRLA